MTTRSMLLLTVSALMLCLLSVVPSGAWTADANVDDSIPLEVLSRVRRVIGGEPVEAGQWPYLVHLMGKVPDTTFWGIPISYNKFYCGGSVINKRWILTAAHCFKQHHYKHPDRMLKPKYWHAKVGEVEAEHGLGTRLLGRWHRLIGNKDQGLWMLHAEKIILHPDYNEYDNWKNDLALLKVEEDLPVGPNENQNIGPVDLPSSVPADWPTSGTNCVMKGWGCSAKGGSVEDVARAVSMPAVQNFRCRNTFPGLGLDTRVCAGLVDGAVGICRGDSGGPLVCDYQGRWIQAGVASFTSATRPGKVPGVFTRVSAYLSWIQRNTKV